MYLLPRSKKVNIFLSAEETAMFHLRGEIYVTGIYMGESRNCKQKEQQSTNTIIGNTRKIEQTIDITQTEVHAQLIILFRNVDNLSITRCSKVYIYIPRGISLQVHR